MPLTKHLLHYPALITHLTGLGNYSRIHYQQGKTTVLAKSLLYFQESWPYFIRTHKSTLVNPYYIKALQVPSSAKIGGAVRLQDGTPLLVSRRRWGSLARGLARINSPLASELAKYSLLNSYLGTKPSDPNLFVVMESEVDQILLRQLVNQVASQWNLYFFASPLALQAVFLNLDQPLRPALFLIQGSQPMGPTLALLDWMNHQVTLQLIPTLVIATSQSGDLPHEWYALGVNAIINQPQNGLQFMEVLEKVLPRWLHLESVNSTP